MRAKYVNMGPGEKGLRFYCPGCHQSHVVRVVGGSHWNFNGDMDYPTLIPSVDVKGGHYAHTPPVPGNCYCDFHLRHPEKGPAPWKCTHCHSFVTNGKIHFLPDCTHELANQIVELPDLNLVKDLYYDE